MPLTKEEKREYDKAYRAANPDLYSKRKEWYREYYRKNKEKVKAYKAEWKRNNPGRVLETERKRNLKRNFNLTLDQFEELLAQQNGVCAICGHAETVRVNLSVDHDHNTGKVRGLLCFKCNTSLGHFENTNSLKKAVQYLEHSLHSRHATPILSSICTQIPYLCL